MKILKVIFGVLSLFCGIICFWNPFGTAVASQYVWAAFIGIWGIFSIISFFVERGQAKKLGVKVVSGVSGLVLGILALIFWILHMTIPMFGLRVESLIALFMFVFLLIEGITTIISAFQLGDVGAGPRIFLIVTGILLVLISGFGLANLWIAIAGFGIILGFAFIVNGIKLIASIFVSDEC